jgi:ATP-binding cassette subfamily B protein
MIARHYGRDYSLAAVREKSQMDNQGVSMLGLCEAAEAMGLRPSAADATWDELVNERPFPAIVHWRDRHFVVLYDIDRKRRAHIADPAYGLAQLSREEFLAGLDGRVVHGSKEGTILFFEPGPEFYQQEDVADTTVRRRGLKELAYYMLPYKGHVVQLLLGMFAGSIITLAFAFLTQNLVDIGILGRNIGFVNLVLIAQLMLFLGSAVGDATKSWITLHLGTRVNIAMMSDLLAKLTRLPMAFFDGKMTGDVMQRMGDLSRVQTFITTTLPSTLFMVVTLVVYAIVLLNYNWPIFVVFFAGSVLYAAWIVVFLRKRRELDYRKFDGNAGNQSGLIAFIQGMQEIKLHNAERQHRWKWERVQVKLFKLNIRSLTLEQWQSIGSSVIHKLKNIIITVVAAKAVIAGSITLGMMLTIQFILGSLDGPVTGLVGFMRSFQDASISVERIDEIFARADEEPAGVSKITTLAPHRSIQLSNVSFRYAGADSPLVVKDVNLTIAHGKVTAIVGASGSGKTTLLKLLLKYYRASDGSITVGPHDLEEYKTSFWRDQCGVVMQDGFIFSDTIAHNIAIGHDAVDKARLLYAVKVANLQGFIESLPLAYNTKIGHEGVALSGGQRQRVLIARAVYKDPQFLFFDEATSSLDAHNERIIMDNLHEFCQGRTAVVIAHRLSTVKNADQIIVLRNGELIEQGDHDSLTTARGTYFSLIRNQLELGASV